MTSDPTDTAPTNPPPPERRGRFVAIVSERADGGETCTISPPPVGERKLSAVWVAARDESFVAIEEMR